MSIQAVAWALERDLDDAGAKLVLVSLANHADHRTGRCYPTLETICTEASQSRRTVQDKLKILEKKRLIRVVPDYDKTGRQRANSYYLRCGGDMVQVDEPESLAPQGDEPREGAEFAPSLPGLEEGAELASPEGAPACTQEGANCCTPLKKPSEGNRQKKPSEAAPPALQRAAGPPEAVWIRKGSAQAHRWAEHHGKEHDKLFWNWDGKRGEHGRYERSEWPPGRAPQPPPADVAREHARA